MPRNNVGKQRRLDPRRRDCYRLWMEGKSFAELADIICPAYNVKRKALYYDWQRREEWGDYVIPEDEDKFLVQDALNHLKYLKNQMHEIIKDPRATISERSNGIKTLMNMDFKVIEAYQSLGKVHREATTIRIEEERDRLKTIVRNIAGEDIEKQESLVEALLEYASNSTQNTEN